MKKKCNNKIDIMKTVKGLGVGVSYIEQNKLEPKHFIAGDITHKYPVHLSDERTIVYIDNKEDEARIRKKYEDKLSRINY